MRRFLKSTVGSHVIYVFLLLISNPITGIASVISPIVFNQGGGPGIGDVDGNDEPAIQIPVIDDPITYFEGPYTYVFNKPVFDNPVRFDTDLLFRINKGDNTAIGLKDKIVGEIQKRLLPEFGVVSIPTPADNPTSIKIYLLEKVGNKWQNIGVKAIKRPFDEFLIQNPTIDQRTIPTRDPTVPEPGSLAIMGVLGLGGAAMRIWRKKHDEHGR
jgi:hypothetical protein